jgi:5-methyltetrahydrofolate--homocysteine methyltransferase
VKTKLSSRKAEVVIGDELPTVLIGERLNPTGKKKLSAALLSGNYELVRNMALDQVRAGADILDVNAGVAGADEVALLKEMVRVVVETVDVPLCIDSKDPKALEASLEIYPGKALINSVTGEEASLRELLPLIKEHSAVVIGLTVDDEGIPKGPEQRLRIASKIVEKAESLGIPREDVVIDCLVMTLGADSNAGIVALEAVRKIRSELGVNMTCGASNISFGVPDRVLLNNTFLSMVIEAGINCPIVDVSTVRPTVLATDFILGHDRYAKRYSKGYRQRMGR